MTLTSWGFVLARLFHFIGFSAAIGACIAGLMVMRQSVDDAAHRAGIDRAASAIVTTVELPGAFLALFGGIALIVMVPNVLDPATSGAGPWLHIKLAFVVGALVVAHLRMFNLIALGREPSDALRKKAKTLDVVNLGLYLAVLFIVIFRYVLFA